MASIARAFPAALFLFSVISAGATAQEGATDPSSGPSSAYRGKVADLVQASGMDVMMRQMVDGMLQQIEPALRGAVRQEIEAAGETISDAQLTRALGAFREDMVARLQGFYPMLAPVYAQHFTMEEIEYLLWIYDRPTVKKAVRLQPQMSQSLAASAEGWFSDNAEQAMTRALEEALGAP